jgi:8-oxo-dGTP pyrophosphatase MutT (NUDIX family)
VGIQIPAGTVYPGEDIESAARREGVEESGLTDLVLQCYLGQADDPPPPGYLIVAAPTTVYSRPDSGSMDWAHFRAGVPVEVLRYAVGFTQVRYEETDRFIDPQHVSGILLVIPDPFTSQRRHLYGSILIPLLTVIHDYTSSLFGHH